MLEGDKSGQRFALEHYLSPPLDASPMRRFPD
jgi:hypothetical protein